MVFFENIVIPACIKQTKEYYVTLAKWLIANHIVKEMAWVRYGRTAVFVASINWVRVMRMCPQLAVEELGCPEPSTYLSPFSFPSPKLFIDALMRTEIGYTELLLIACCCSYVFHAIYTVTLKIWDLIDLSLSFYLPLSPMYVCAYINVGILRKVLGQKEINRISVIKHPPKIT